MTCITSNVFEAAVTSNARSTFYIADWETGQSQAHGENPDGMQIYCHRDDSPTAMIGFSSGGCDADSPSDVKILQSEVTPNTGAGTGGDTVTPRKGNYMMRSAIYGDKDYTAWGASGTDRPRCTHQPKRATGDIGNPYVRYDETTWMGVSIYLPANVEPSPSNKRNALMEATSEGSSSTHLEFGLDFPENSGGTGRWTMKLYVNDSSITEGSSYKQPNFDLGSYTAEDAGQWTDFVFQVCFNPFTTSRNGSGPTNANTISGGRNITMEHNRGTLRIWKTTGPAGNRVFTEITDTDDGIKLPIIDGYDANGVNVGVGLVPYNGYDVSMGWRQYRPTWRENPSGSPDTGLDGPQFIWWDCFYYSEEDRDGGSFSDVNPDQLPQP